MLADNAIRTRTRDVQWRLEFFITIRDVSAQQVRTKNQAGLDLAFDLIAA